MPSPAFIIVIPYINIRSVTITPNLCRKSEAIKLSIGVRGLLLTVDSRYMIDKQCELAGTSLSPCLEKPQLSLHAYVYACTLIICTCIHVCVSRIHCTQVAGHAFERKPGTKQSITCTVPERTCLRLWLKTRHYLALSKVTPPSETFGAWFL